MSSVNSLLEKNKLFLANAIKKGSMKIEPFFFVKS